MFKIETNFNIPWYRWFALIVLMFAVPALADFIFGMWAGWIVALPAGVVVARFLL